MRLTWSAAVRVDEFKKIFLKQKNICTDFRHPVCEGLNIQKGSGHAQVWDKTLLGFGLHNNLFQIYFVFCCMYLCGYHQFLFYCCLFWPEHSWLNSNLCTVLYPIGVFSGCHFAKFLHEEKAEPTKHIL